MGSEAKVVTSGAGKPSRRMPCCGCWPSRHSSTARLRLCWRLATRWSRPRDSNRACALCDGMPSTCEICVFDDVTKDGLVLADVMMPTGPCVEKPKVLRGCACPLHACTQMT